MNHIIAFSGGNASSVTASLVLSQYHDAVLLYHSTNTEPVDNDRFRTDVSNYLGTPILEDSDGRNIWKVFEDEGYLGNGRNTMCSRILKQERSLNYLLNHLPVTLYIGFTPDEWARAQRVTARYAKYSIAVKFPLIDNNIGKKECFHRVVNCWGITPPDMYKWAEHANCVPCIKGKKAYWGLIHMFAREAWEKASLYEEKFGNTIFTQDGSLKEELSNCLRLARNYMQRREGEERQTSLFDFPCECML